MRIPNGTEAWPITVTFLADAWLKYEVMCSGWSTPREALCTSHAAKRPRNGLQWATTHSQRSWTLYNRPQCRQKALNGPTTTVGWCGVFHLLKEYTPGLARPQKRSLVFEYSSHKDTVDRNIARTSRSALLMAAWVPKHEREGQGCVSRIAAATKKTL